MPNKYLVVKSWIDRSGDYDYCEQELVKDALVLEHEEAHILTLFFMNTATKDNRYFLVEVIERPSALNLLEQAKIWNVEQQKIREEQEQTRLERESQKQKEKREREEQKERELYKRLHKKYGEAK